MTDGVTSLVRRGRGNVLKAVAVVTPLCNEAAAADTTDDAVSTDAPY